MKIACIGNMNNIIAPTAQYLAEMGHNVDLFLLYEYDHFSPDADYLNPADIKFNIKRLEMNFGDVMQIKKEDLMQALDGYDFYIGTDYAPALLARINKRIDIFAWAGTDLFDWPFYRSAFRIPQQWEKDKIRTAKFQLEGIRQARTLPMSLNNDFILNTLQKIGFKNSIIPPLPFMYYPGLEKVTQAVNQLTQSIDEAKAAGNLILVQQSRQWWKTAPANISKGNDIFLKGLAKFKAENPAQKFRCYLFAYGADVEASKALIAELGLEADIVWLPVMLRREILAVLKRADIGVGQFGVESWYLYCSNAEILATTGVYLGHRDDAFYERKNCDLYPMLNANSSDEIAVELKHFVEQKGHTQMGKTAIEWLKKYNETEFLNNIQKELNAAKNRSQKLDFINRFRLGLTHVITQLAYFLNKLVLSTKIGFLKTTLLDWKRI